MNTGSKRETMKSWNWHKKTKMTSWCTKRSATTSSTRWIKQLILTPLYPAPSTIATSLRKKKKTRSWTTVTAQSARLKQEKQPHFHMATNQMSANHVASSLRSLKMRKTMWNSSTAWTVQPTRLVKQPTLVWSIQALLKMPKKILMNSWVVDLYKGPLQL